MIIMIFLKFMHDNEVVILDEKVVTHRRREIAHTTLKCSKMKINSLFIFKADYIEQKNKEANMF